MPDHYQRPYLDSSVWISWVMGEIRNNVDRKAVVTHILTLAEQKAFRIYISALTMAEVHKKRHIPKLTDAQDQRLLAFFEHDYIEIIDVDREIGEKANEFCRQYGLSPNDAIHLACALRAGCDVLLAWDGDLLKLQHPSISTEEPRALGQLSLDIGDGGAATATT